MSTAELILEKARQLPDELQQEALHYVDSLLARQTETKENRDWSRFSAQQLANQYSPADAICDETTVRRLGESPAAWHPVSKPTCDAL